MSLPPHHDKRLKSILAVIPPTKIWVSVYTWHQVLGELQSMVITLPGNVGLFSQIKESLRQVIGSRLTMIIGVHNALADFCSISEDLLDRSTQILKLVPLTPILTGNHGASGYMCGGHGCQDPPPSHVSCNDSPVLPCNKWT